MPVQTPKSSHTQALLYHARSATPFRSDKGQPFASLPTGIESRCVQPLRSAAFRDWLIANFYSEYETAPSPSALRSAIRTLEAQAGASELPAQRVNRRISFEGDSFTPSKIILDLANSANELLEITGQGWRTTDNLRHSFRQSFTTLPILNPEQPDTNHQPLATLRNTLNITTDADWHRLLAWLLTALHPTGPYPILVLNGPAGSGKSFLARALRALIDPSTVPVYRLPARDRQLLLLASHNWMLIFDHIHRIAPKISEALCAISSGDALEIPQPDLRDPLVFQVARPMILIAPHDETRNAWTPPRTLSNRTVTIHLEHIAAPRREAKLWSEFEALRPSFSAALCHAVSTALGRIRDIDVGNVARFPDCAAWAAAAAPALGLEEPAVITALTDTNSIWTGSDPLREAVHVFLQQTGAWTGDATDLLNHLRTIAPSAALPANPRSLSQALLNVPGIHVVRHKGTDGKRTVTIAKTNGAKHKIDTAEACGGQPTL